MAQLWSLVPEVLPHARYEPVATDKELRAMVPVPCSAEQEDCSPAPGDLVGGYSTQHERGTGLDSWMGAATVIRSWLSDSFPEPPPPQPQPHASPPLPAPLSSFCSAIDTTLSRSNQTIRQEPSGEGDSRDLEKARAVEAEGGGVCVNKNSLVSC